MNLESSAVTVYQRLMLEVGDRLLEHLRSIALDLTVAHDRLADASRVDTSRMDDARESIQRALNGIDLAEDDLRKVLTTISLDSTDRPGSHDKG